MSIKFSYKDRMDLGREGGLSGSLNYSLSSKTLRGESAAFGVALQLDIKDGCCAIHSNGDVFGVCVRDRTVNEEFNGHTNGDDVNIYLGGQGGVLVTAKVDVVADDPVFWDSGWVKSGGSEFTNARYDLTALAGSLTKIVRG